MKKSRFLSSLFLTCIIGILSSGCSNQNIDGFYKVDISKSNLDPTVERNSDVGKMLVAMYESITYEIKGKQLLMSIEGWGTAKCTITRLDEPNGVECQIQDKPGEEGRITVGLFRDGSTIYVSDEKNPKLVLYKVESTIASVKSPASSTSKGDSSSSEVASRSDPKVFVIGKWAGEPGWDCTDPIVITRDSVSLGTGKEKSPLEIDGDGDVVLGKEGPFLRPDFTNDSLTYGGGESGDSFTLKRCP